MFDAKTQAVLDRIGRDYEAAVATADLLPGEDPKALASRASWLTCSLDMALRRGAHPTARAAARRLAEVAVHVLLTVPK